MLKFFLLVVGTAVVAPGNVQALWPIPKSLETGTTFLTLAHSFDIKLTVNHPPKDLLDAISRTKSYIRNDKLQRLAVGRGANDSAAVSHARSLPVLSVALSKGSAALSIAAEAVKPLAERSEGYSLTVPSDGSPATLTANSTLGLLRGLTTFEQLWYDLNGVTYSYQAPVKIVDDVPAFVSPPPLVVDVCMLTPTYKGLSRIYARYIEKFVRAFFLYSPTFSVNISFKLSSG
jgi:hexosaminidase